MQLAEVKRAFSGEIVLPEDAAYESVQNSLFAKGAPAVIFRPRSTEDVAKAVRYAQESGAVLSVRSGGHSVAGFSTNQKGVVIDLSLMHEVEVLDADKHLVRLGPGAKWGDVAETLAKHNLAISSGDTLSVGVGGLTLGGGVGWMLRKYGLAIDSLRAAEVVTSDGDIIRTSKTEHPDLFWALRGGGGNFGVVTSFEFEAHPVGKVWAGHVTYGLDNLQALITGWRDAMRNASNDLTTMLVILPSFMDMPPSAIVMCCFAIDDKAAADKALAPFRKLGKVVSDDIKQKEYYQVLEAAQPPPFRNIVKNGFVPKFDDKLIKQLADLYTPTSGPVLQVRWLGGAMAKVPGDDTAFAHRDSEALIVSPAFVPFDAPEAAVEKALEPWQKIQPFTTGGYIGFFSERNEDTESLYTKATYDRLAKVKKTYDPKNLFNQNYNVKPA